jgi:hypothetical protein
MKTTAAKEIRKQLKRAFPDTKFSVRTDGGAIRINWNNGPTTQAVNDITKCYEYGHFNGMEDIYEYSNVDKNIPQVKFVMTQRDIDDEIILARAKLLANKYAGCENEIVTMDNLYTTNHTLFNINRIWTFGEFANQELSKEALI